MIDLFAKMGWAWDLKKVNPSVVAKKVGSTGNPLLLYRKGTTVWEWSTGMVTAFSTFIFFFLLRETFKGYFPPEQYAV